MRKYNFIYFAAIITSLIGCAQQPIQTPQVAQKETTETPSPATKAFEPDTLYALLTAEIAGNRQRYDVSLANYTQQAIQTRDPQVAERAYNIARYLNVKPATTEAALLWSEVDPNNESAHSAAIFALIDANRLLEALDLTRKVKTFNNGAFVQNIAASAGTLNTKQRGVLANHYKQLIDESPSNTPLRLGYALLLQQQGQLLESLSLAESIIKKNPKNTTAAILMSGVLHQLKRPKEAVNRIEKLLKQNPNNTRLQLQYARLLAYTDLDKSQSQFQQLVNASPNDPDLSLALALVAEERKDYKVAEKTYQHLLKSNQHTSGAHYHLALIALQQEQKELALKHFLQVDAGNELMTAIAQIQHLYVEDGDITSAVDHAAYHQLEYPKQARQIGLIHSNSLLRFNYLKEADIALTYLLTLNPADVDALYSRAMVYDKLNNVAKAEQDLRAMLKIDPNNATALNTLGYVLLEKSSRHQEAFGYIEQALKIQPSDPAIIDSMGWAHYKLGNLNEARDYLQRAMDLYPDHEIAAHLGEVQWAMGEKRNASSTWKKGLKLHPESKYILNTLKQLQIELD